MSACEMNTRPIELELPAELADLEGLLRADLDAIARMIAARAHERLFLPRSAFRALYLDLWNNLAAQINRAVAPLSAESR